MSSRLNSCPNAPVVGHRSQDAMARCPYCSSRARDFSPGWEAVLPPASASVLTAEELAQTFEGMADEDIYRTTLSLIYGGQMPLPINDEHGLPNAAKDAVVKCASRSVIGPNLTLSDEQWEKAIKASTFDDSVLSLPQVPDRVIERLLEDMLARALDGRTNYDDGEPWDRLPRKTRPHDAFLLLHTPRRFFAKSTAQILAFALGDENLRLSENVIHSAPTLTDEAQRFIAEHAHRITKRVLLILVEQRCDELSFETLAAIDRVLGDPATLSEFDKYAIALISQRASRALIDLTANNKPLREWILEQPGTTIEKLAQPDLMMLGATLYPDPI